MADLYVSTTGSDSNSGSKTSPFQSIEAAAAHAEAGTIVHVAPGTYQGGIHTEEDGVTYVSDVKWGARIVPGPGNDQREAWNNLGDDVVIDGFEIDGSQPAGGAPWLYGVLTSGTSSMVRNVKVHDIARDSEAWNAANSGNQGGAGIMADGFNGDTGIRVTDNLVYDIGPDGTASTLVHGIYIGTTGWVQDNTVHDIAGDGVTSWHDATDLTITGNAIDAVRGAGILIGAGQHHHGSGPNDHSLVIGNTVTNSTKGIEEAGETGENISYLVNEVHGNGTDWSLQTGTRSTEALDEAWATLDLPDPKHLLDEAGLAAFSSVTLPDGLLDQLDAVSTLLAPLRSSYDAGGGFFT